MCLDLQRYPLIGGPAQNLWDLCRYERLELACSSPALLPPWPMDRDLGMFGYATATATWVRCACWVSPRNHRRWHLATESATRGSCVSREFQRAHKGEIPLFTLEGWQCELGAFVRSSCNFCCSKLLNAKLRDFWGNNSFLCWNFINQWDCVLKQEFIGCFVSCVVFFVISI